MDKYKGMESLVRLPLSLSDDVRYDELLCMQPPLAMMLTFIIQWCSKNSCEVNITSLYRSPEYNKHIGAKSTTHCEGRAVDFSSSSHFGFNEKKRRELIKAVEQEFLHIGAINHVGESRPILHHDIGNGAHFHIQVRRNL